MDVIVSPMPWPASTWKPAAVRRRPVAALCYWLPLCLRPASTPCLYAYGLPFSSSSYHCHYIIVIVHSVFKWNVYLSLLCDLYVFFPLSSFLNLFFFIFFF
jgi:hypothetical protein